MSDVHQPPLIICDGSLPGLVVCWAETVARAESSVEGGPLKATAWMAMDDRPARGRRETALKRHVQMCGMSGPAAGEVVSCAGAASDGMRASAMLQSAAAQAVALGLRRVVWPVHWSGLGEPELDWLADVTDRAMLVGQLASIDVPRVVEGSAGGAVRIETPYADFDDGDLLELALDMDVPIGASWWCEREGERPCGGCAACVRWRAALEQVDPQGLVHVAGVR